MKFYLILILSLFSNITKSSNTEELVFVSIDQIHPTQAFIGYDQIDFKIQKIEKYFKKEKLKPYLKKKWAPAILGPDNKLWIIDHHHLSFAILHSKISKKYKGIYIRKIFDWSHYNWNRFYKEMEEKKYLYLKDNNFRLISFKSIPKNIKNLKDNPFRSLAYFAREKKCFKKVEVPFLEFIWGEYFYNQGIRIDFRRDYRSLLKRSIDLCHKKGAEGLPGYINK